MGMKTKKATVIDRSKPNEFMVRAAQVGLARKSNTSHIGTEFSLGDKILHLSSARCTGEVFTLTYDDIMKIVSWFHEPSSNKPIDTDYASVANRNELKKRKPKILKYYKDLEEKNPGRYSHAITYAESL